MNCSILQLGMALLPRSREIGRWEAWKDKGHLNGKRGRDSILGAPVKRASTRVKVPSVQLDGSAPKTVPTASPRGGVGKAQGQVNRCYQLTSDRKSG